VIYWEGLWAWFQADDFVWLGIQGRPLWEALFQPTANQGSFRPLSERVFFLLFHSLFGLNALPYRIFVFAVFFAALILLASVVRRLTGSETAAVLAAVFWIVNPAMATVMSWTAASVHLSGAFFILLAFYLLLLHDETGKWRYYWLQVAVFVLGFGVLEVNVVYPALATGFALLRARHLLKHVLPLFAISALFLLWEPRQQAGAYALHFDGAMLNTFKTYWRFAVFPPQATDVWPINQGQVALLVRVMTLALAGWLVWSLWKRRFVSAFLMAWFVILVSPFVPLRDHIEYYYLTVPLMGMAAFAGEAVARSRNIFAWLLAVVYIVFAIPVTRHYTALRAENSHHAERIVYAVREAVKDKPDAIVVLDDVDNDTFWSVIWDRPFGLVGANQVYLAQGSEARIAPSYGRTQISDFVLKDGVDSDKIVRVSCQR
jgi:hypothetical protein